jgi:hypothetical protein
MAWRETADMMFAQLMSVELRERKAVLQEEEVVKSLTTVTPLDDVAKEYAKSCIQVSQIMEAAKQRVRG